MKKPKLTIIENAQPIKKGRWQGDDDVFLHKSQVKVGTRLVCFGRLDHGSEWRVAEIVSIAANNARRRREAVKSLLDTIILVKIGSNETRQCLFANLSYSAIWRLK